MVLGALGSLAVWLLPSWFPVSAAVQAQRQDTLYFWLMVMSSFIFSLVIVFLVYMMVKFRAKPGDDSDGAPIHGHTGLEIVWTVIPISSCWASPSTAPRPSTGTRRSPRTG